MITCPKCHHIFTQPPTWKDYLKKRGSSGAVYKVHFFSNKGTSETPHVVRTRLYFDKTVLRKDIKSALELVRIEHCRDPFFRWCDTPISDIENVLDNLYR